MIHFQVHIFWHFIKCFPKIWAGELHHDEQVLELEVILVVSFLLVDDHVVQLYSMALLHLGKISHDLYLR